MRITKTLCNIIIPTISLIILGSFLSACSGKSAAVQSQVQLSSGNTAGVQSQASNGSGATAAASQLISSGDIPDSQVFVTYQSAAGGYQLEVPEGWARTEQGADVNFIAQLDGLKVNVSAASSAPTLESIKANQIPALVQSGQALQVSNVQAVNLPNGSAIQVEYTSNSEPDPVTGKQVRLENQTYFYFHNGHLAALTLWAPLGADNVDQWQRISQSFGWSS